MSLGSSLKRARVAAGLSQADVAKAFGISRESISQWESEGSEGGRKPARPDIEKIPALARLYGTTVGALLAGIDYVAPWEKPAVKDAAVVEAFGSVEQLKERQQILDRTKAFEGMRKTPAQRTRAKESKK